jgi:prepilin-type processing-associated H-X9-DG protein
VLHFGSAHPTGLNVMMCDGSLHFTTYDIDPATWLIMGRRQ